MRSCVGKRTTGGGQVRGEPEETSCGANVGALNGSRCCSTYSSMKTTAVAAFAALLAVARIGVAGTTGSPGSADDEVVRATTEARAIVATMQNNARVARDALELARRRRNPAPVRCADEALSLADVALRRGREDVTQMAAQFGANDPPAARATLERLRWRASASHEAAATASRCNAQDVPVDHTVVIVSVRSLGAGLAGQLDAHP